MPHDLFLSHASEDKSYVNELARALKARGYSVWLDSTELTLGDSLSQRIDDGLANSKYGVVLLSEHFFAKQWTQRELSGLVAREISGSKVILPIWHGVDRDIVARHSPTLADRLGVSSAKGLPYVCDQIARVLGPVNEVVAGPATMNGAVASTPETPLSQPGAEDDEHRITLELRAKYADDEICPRCGEPAHVYGYDGSDGDSFDWLECRACALFLPLS